MNGHACKVKAVRIYRGPAYPQLWDETGTEPLLARYVPLSWRQRKVVAGALAAFVLCGGCRQEYVEKMDPSTLVLPAKKAKDQSNTTAASDASKIAPLFLHGQGSGSIGCVVMAPPGFISESEAKALIEKELGKEGFSFEANGYALTVPATCKPGERCCEHDKLPASQTAEFRFDGYDRTRKLAYDFVSRRDYEALFGLDCSTVARIRTKKAASFLRDRMSADGRVNGVVFYDPIPERRRGCGLTRDEANESSKEMLLAQVEDFIAWAKREGVIKRRGK